MGRLCKFSGGVGSGSKRMVRVLCLLYIRSMPQCKQLASRTMVGLKLYIQLQIGWMRVDISDRSRDIDLRHILSLIGVLSLLL